MSNISRGRYALYLIARPFQRLRNTSEREVIALAEVPLPPEETAAPHQADEVADLSSLESVPVEAIEANAPPQPGTARGNLRMEGAASVLSNIRQSSIDFLGRLHSFLPWAETAEGDSVPGDDPTFQQLLMLSGLFCGPVMFFIGGLLFCVMPREHSRTRKWSCWNGLLALASLFYIVSTTTMDDLPRQRSPGIHLQEAQDHQRMPSTETGVLTLLPKHVQVSSIQWRAGDQDADRTLLSSSHTFIDQYVPFKDSDMPGVPSLGPDQSWLASKGGVTIGPPRPVSLSGLVNLRYMVAANENLKRSNTSRFFVDCGEGLDSETCVGEATFGGVVSGGLSCSRDGADAKFVPLWQLTRRGSGHEGVEPRVEDGSVRFDAKEAVVCTPEIRVAAPAPNQTDTVYPVSIRVWV